MRSPLGAAAAAALSLSIPVALGYGIITGQDGAETIIHFGIGVSAMLLAAALFDFPAPRWVTTIAAVGLGGFGAILTLQGVSELVDVPALTTFAFKVLGQGPERILPWIFLAGVAGLALATSASRTRLFGVVVVSVAIAIEVAQLIGPAFGIEVPNPKLHMVLPILWLLAASLKHAPGNGPAFRSGHGLADGAAS
jgi:hypothetical protein